MSTSVKASEEIRTLYIKYLLIITSVCFVCYFMLYETETNELTIEQQAAFSFLKHENAVFSSIEYLDKDDDEVPLKSDDYSSQQDTTSFLKLNLIQIDNFFIDPKKSAVFFTQDRKFILTHLFLTKFDTSKILKLQIRTNEKVYFFNQINQKGQTIYRNNYYYSYATMLVLEQLNCDVNTKVWYKFQIDGVDSDEFPVLVVANDHMTKPNTLTARLIKCIWYPSDLKAFEYIMKLIIESRYDDIYVCLFASDEKLKRVVRKFNSMKKINIIELENLPNFNQNGKFLKSFEEGFAIQNSGELFDPAEEFLLNLIYPFLINKYRYVHAADYDHIVFAHNQTFYQRTQTIIQRNQAPTDASLYLNQYWALENNLSMGILSTVGDYLKSKSVDIEESDEKLKSYFIKVNYPVILNTPGSNFKLRIDNQIDMLNGVSMLKKLRSSLESSENKMFRFVVLKFTHPSIYGQTIHNTKSSMQIKLCEAGMYFRNGLSVRVQWPHSIHYRDTYNFDLIKVDGKYIAMSSFSFLVDTEK